MRLWKTWPSKRPTHTPTATATVTYHGPGRAKMIIVDLGLPPGFTLLPDELSMAIS